MKTIQEQPAEIESKQLELSDVINDLANLRTIIHRQELEAAVSVADQRGENNKPLYSNDQKRELATLQALASNAEYKDNCQVARQLEQRKTALAAEIDRLRREHRLALIDYEASQLGRRAA
jgi:hypothetical protein